MGARWLAGSLYTGSLAYTAGLRSGAPGQQGSVEAAGPATQRGSLGWLGFGWLQLFTAALAWLALA